MKLYRIAKEKYVNDLSGEGARLYGGRWNKKGTSMLYFSESLSLAVLEILVHLDFKFLTRDFSFIEIEISDKLIYSKKISTLEKNWRSNPPSIYTQELGSEWLKKEKNLAMKVPSAIVPLNNNILVNPKHKKISELEIIRTGKLDVDARIFR